MQAAAARVRAGEVTRAVRASESALGPHRGRGLDRAVAKRDRVGRRDALGCDL